MESRAKALQPLQLNAGEVALLLTGAMMFIYFGFILLIAFNTADGVVGASRTGSLVRCLGDCLSMGADLYLRALGKQQL